MPDILKEWKDFLNERRVADIEIVLEEWHKNALNDLHSLKDNENAIELCDFCAELANEINKLQNLIGEGCILYNMDDHKGLHF